MGTGLQVTGQKPGRTRAEAATRARLLSASMLAGAMAVALATVLVLVWLVLGSTLGQVVLQPEPTVEGRDLTA
jgi:hypothetical protein